MAQIGTTGCKVTKKKIILTHFSPKSFCFSINMNKKKAASLCEVAAYVVKMRSSGFVWQE